LITKGSNEKMQNFVNGGREEDQRPPSRPTVLVLGQRDVDCQQTEGVSQIWRAAPATQRHAWVMLTGVTHSCWTQSAG